jgi:hypothetical protein
LPHILEKNKKRCGGGGGLRPPIDDETDILPDV